MEYVHADFKGRFGQRMPKPPMPLRLPRPSFHQVRLDSQSEVNMGTEVVTVTPQASTDPKASANAEKVVTTEEQVAQTWGTDDMWSHGAPVALGNLRGTWYAVQVGLSVAPRRKSGLNKQESD